MNKKAQMSFYMLNFIPRIIFLIIVLFSVIFLVRSYVVDNLNVQDVQAEVFVNKILYSPNGILYYDEDLKITVPGKINPSLLTNERLDALMNYRDESFIAGRLILFDKQNKKVVSAFYNEKTYNRWVPLIGQPGKGGIKEITKSVIVTFIEEEKPKQGFLRFEVLLPEN